MGFVDRLQCLGDTGALDDTVDFRAAAYARGIDEHEVAAVAMERHENAIARRAGHVARDDSLLPEQAIDECRLAHVGAADDGDANGAFAGIFRRRGLRLETGEHLVHQLFAALPVRRGDRHRLAETQGMEIAGDEIEVEALALVERQRYGFARAPQLTQHEVVRGRQPLAHIREENQAVGFLYRLLGLLAHLGLDAGGVLDETSRIDDDVGHRPDPTKAVLPVAGQTRGCRRR